MTGPPTRSDATVPAQAARPRSGFSISPAFRSLLRASGGQALLELVLILPVLFIIVFGVIEAGRGLSFKHRMSVMSREGANIASRGSSLTEAVDVVLYNGADIRLAQRGGAIATQIMIQGTEPVVQAQEASPGYAGQSRFGLEDSTAVIIQTVGFEDGQTIYAVEIFLDYQPLTPLGSFIGGWATSFYERGIF